MLRDVVIALSLANLLFFNVWRYFLVRHPSSYPYFHWKANPAPILLATMVDVLLVNAVLLVAATVTRRSKSIRLHNLSRAVFVGAFYVVITNILVTLLISDEVRDLVDTVRRHPSWLAWRPVARLLSLWLRIVGLAIGFLLTTVLFHRLVFRRRNLSKLAANILLVLSPFVLVTFGQATSQWVRFRSPGGSAHEATRVTGTPNSGRRVVWIIFDEMDFRLSFVSRPVSVQLPEFDRLRYEAIFAENAFPPGGDTVLSLPSLFSGRFVSWGARTAPDELILTIPDAKQTLPWSKIPNIFSRAREAGVNSGLVGWYHPYCRIIGSSLTRCSWSAPSTLFMPDTDIADLASDSNASLSKTMLAVARSAFVPSVFRVLGVTKQGSTWRRHHFSDYTDIHREAMNLVGDPTLQLVVLHYPIPHPPGIYDRSKRDFSFNSTNDYLDNLELADRTLGELRQEIEQAGLWESTTLLVSSDHHLRADRVWKNHVMWRAPFTFVDPIVSNSVSDERVPFIIRIPGENRSHLYKQSFNTVLSGNLVLSILSGETPTHESAVKWLEQHRSIGQSPYVEGEK